MTCKGCKVTEKKVLTQLDGVDSVQESLDDRMAIAIIKPGKMTENKLVEAIEKVGYAAKKKVFAQKIVRIEATFEVSCE